MILGTDMLNFILVGIDHTEGQIHFKKIDKVERGDNEAQCFLSKTLSWKQIQ